MTINQHFMQSKQPRQPNVDKMYKATRVGNCLLNEAKVTHADKPMLTKSSD